MFVPINTIAYANAARQPQRGLEPDEHRAQHRRQLGIGATTAMLARATQANQNLLVAHLTPYEAPYRAALEGLTQRFAMQGGDPARAELAAQAVLAGALDGQARMLAFTQQFALLAVAFLALVPVVMLMRRRAPARHVELALE